MSQIGYSCTLNGKTTLISVHVSGFIEIENETFESNVIVLSNLCTRMQDAHEERSIGSVTRVNETWQLLVKSIPVMS